MLVVGLNPMAKSIPIRNCEVTFRKVCPLQWDMLNPTADPAVRSCDMCHREVYLCESDEEALRHAKAGDCIAKFIPDISGVPRLVFGEPEVPTPSPTPEQKALLKAYHRENAKTDALENLKYSSRFCPQCGYPCPDWKPVCRVCDFEIGRIRFSDGRPEKEPLGDESQGPC